MTESGRAQGLTWIYTLLDSVRTLQTTYASESQNEPAAVSTAARTRCAARMPCRAYRRCAYRGAPGVDGRASSGASKNTGGAATGERLQQELTGKRYHPALLRVMAIPKASGGEQPLGIPCIRDRVVQMAVLLVVARSSKRICFITADDFRTGLERKMALRRIHFGIADREMRARWSMRICLLANTIPHGDPDAAVSPGESPMARYYAVDRND